MSVDTSRRTAAHPRSRGENHPGEACGAEGEGSSPLTRGKRGAGFRSCLRCRLIPAHAGKTGTGPLTRMKISAHPRSRGENRPRTAVLPARCGSSPLTRGKRLGVFVSLIRDGLIPAHAGKTPGRGGQAGRGEAHPRSRGENGFWPCVRMSAGGSSPLTRGKQRHNVRRGESVGLIPAHAGKTANLLLRRARRTAHPRSRGENSDLLLMRMMSPGSSPLTRGKRQKWSVVRIARRLIPAHAGKTPRRTHRLRTTPAHPRSRGENAATHSEPGISDGSSPLTRGKRHNDRRHAPRRRLIPAHAGKTPLPGPIRTAQTAHPRSRGENPPPSGARASGPAHPRSRGENDLAALTGRRDVGSSPLTRGKPG